MSSDLRASLLSLGFNLSQARAAVLAGNNTVESATEWIFANNDNIGSAGTQEGTRLRLFTQEDKEYDADLQKALEESRSVQASQPPPTTPTTRHQQEHLSPTDDPIDQHQLSSSPKKIKINIIHAPAPSSVTAPLPLTSRHNEREIEAQNATRLAEANRRAEKIKKDKMEARIAHRRALDALKEDHENRKSRNQSATTASSTDAHQNPPLASNHQQSSTATTTATNSSKSSSNTLVQLRMKDGSMLKRSFPSTATIKEIFDLAHSEDRNIGNADISLIQPFPRREFTVRDNDLTLIAADLCPSCSLNVLVQTPIIAPQPVAPSAWIPSTTDAESQEPTPMDIDMDSDTVNYLPHFGNGGNDNHQENIESQVEDENEQDVDNSEDEADDEDHDMHALPIVDQINPNHPFPMLGQGRGGGRGRGRGGIPFSGTGHSLGSNGPVVTSGGQDSIQPNLTPAERDMQRRERFLEAMALRSKAQEEAPASTNPTADSKKVKGREIPSLQSLCSYQVAVMLAARDAKSNANLRLWGEQVGSQAGEAVVQDLIRLKLLDQLTFRRFYSCPIVNLCLDSYSRATDSLMDVVGGSQARSLTYLTLKGCTFLTDAGFSNIARLELLEFLDLSHCRITDKTLDYTLNLPCLSTLNLSATRVSTLGLAKTVSDAAWKSNLHTLDLSYCKQIAGPSVMYILRELEELRTLKLNSTMAFDSSPVRVPDIGTFSHLLHFDVASTNINDEDIIALIPILETVEKLTLTSCEEITPEALECVVQKLTNLQDLKFPSRNHNLFTVLPTAATLPLTHLDLSEFKLIGDEAILSLKEAKNLQMLSLSGTMLTDVGSAVLVHMSSLKELLLDRTDITDKTIEYLRDLGRIEVLSLSQVKRLTTAGVNHLGKSAFFSLRLKRLNLMNNRFIHDEALAVFVNCKGLTTLNLDNTDVSETKALLLQASLPNLTQLRIRGVTNGKEYEQNPQALLTRP